MFSIILAVLILFTHQKNIRSMIKGTEPKIDFKSKKNEK
jgi:glycerol-3-phosphate acyltransferase PlsY